MRKVNRRSHTRVQKTGKVSSVMKHKMNVKTPKIIKITHPKKRETFVSDEGFEFTFPPEEDTIIMKETKDGFEADYITRDEFAQSPNEIGDEDVTFLVNYHRDFDVEMKNKITESELSDFYQGKKISQLKEYFIFPIDSYIHSGVSIKLSGGFDGILPQGHRQFDVSSVGAILVSKKEVTNNKKTARKFAQGQVEEWNNYLSGDVWNVVSEKYDKNKKLIDYDTVGGFSGYDFALENRGKI